MDLKEILKLQQEREADVEALKRVARMLSEPQQPVVRKTVPTPDSGEASEKRGRTTASLTVIPVERQSVNSLVRKAIEQLPPGDFTVREVRAKMATFVPPDRMAKISGTSL